MKHFAVWLFVLSPAVVAGAWAKRDADRLAGRCERPVEPKTSDPVCWVAAHPPADGGSTGSRTCQ